MRTILFFQKHYGMMHTIMMNSEITEKLFTLDNNDFKGKVILLTQEEKDQLLFYAIDTLQDFPKYQILLEEGANAAIHLGEEKIMLWTIAFARDKYAKIAYTPLLTSYIFSNFTPDYISGAEKIIQNALRLSEGISQKSAMAYNSFGYESPGVKKKLDNEYRLLLDKLADDLEVLSAST